MVIEGGAGGELGEEGLDMYKNGGKGLREGGRTGEIVGGAGLDAYENNG